VFNSESGNIFEVKKEIDRGKLVISQSESGVDYI